MKYAILDSNRKIINIIEIEPNLAADFNAHYLGNAKLGIGNVYPETDFRPDGGPAETQYNIQQLTAKMDYIAMMVNVDMEDM